MFQQFYESTPAAAGSDPQPAGIFVLEFSFPVTPDFGSRNIPRDGQELAGTNPGLTGRQDAGRPFLFCPKRIQRAVDTGLSGS